MLRTFFTPKNLCLAAIVAALYVTLTLVFQAISFGAVQFRISEALTLLPVMMPAAVPGVIVGCFLSNVLYGAAVYDIVFGTLATALAAMFTYMLRKNVWLAAVPPVLFNAVIIGLVLTYAYGIDILAMNMFTVGLGQAVVCYAVGVPLVMVLKKMKFLK